MSVNAERHSRRWFLQWIAAGGAAVAVAAVGGKIYGENELRGQLFPAGELTPELERKLTAANHSIVKIQGWTAASLREAGWNDVPDFPLPVSEGDPDPQNTPSIRRWLAIGPGGIYLPREEDDVVGDLAGDLRTANTAAGRIDTTLGFGSGDLSDFLEAEIASLRSSGETLFQAGYVVTSHQVEIDGVINGIAIGRATPEDPDIGIITFDATRETPLPPNISAGGFVVAK